MNAASKFIAGWETAIRGLPKRTGNKTSFLREGWGHALHMVSRTDAKNKYTAMCHCTPGPAAGDTIEFWWTHPKAELTPEEMARGRKLGQVATGTFTAVRPCGNPEDMYEIEFIVEGVDPPYTPKAGPQARSP